MTTTVWHFDFDAANETSVATHYSGLPMAAGGLQVYTNGWTGIVSAKVCGVVFQEGTANPDTDSGTMHTKDHWVKGTVKNLGLYKFGLLVRATGDSGGSTDSGYITLVTNDALIRLWRFTNSVFTLLASGVPSATIVVGDTITLTARGSTLTVDHNTTTVITHTDTTHTSGGVGCSTYTNTLSDMGDDLYSGNASIQKQCQNPRRNWGHQYRDNRPGHRQRARFNRIANVR